jgi:hypothetical protein
MSRALAAILLAAALGACGVKAPPRASGVPAHAPPNELFKPAEDSGKAIAPAGEPAR